MPRRGTELVDGPPGIRVAVVVDDDESPDRQAVVQNFECCVRRGVGARVDPQEGDLLDRRVRQRGRDLTLQEAHAIVEEVEARERVSDDVQIGPLVHVAPGRALGRSRCLRPREPAERIGHPDDLGGDLVRGKVTAHEDRAATTPGSALDEVAGHVLAANDFEARLEMLQPVMPHRRGREPRLRAGSRRTGASSNLELPREPEQEPLRVVQLCRLRSLAAFGAPAQVLETHLVLEVVLVEQRTLEEVEVAVRGRFEPPLVGEVQVVLEEKVVQADRFGELELAQASLGTLELVEHARQPRALRQPPLVHHDGEPEVERHDHHAE